MIENQTEKQFNELATKWKKETGGYSTLIHITGNKNYLEIIEMGAAVVPYILKDLAHGPEHWFIALIAITKENPVTKEDMCDIEKMRTTWLEWGKREGKQNV